MQVKQPKKDFRPIRKQPTPEELTEYLLDLIQRKFYEGQAVEFRKDRALLLQWVVLWPAKWLNERGVTLAVERYKAIVAEVVIEATKFSAEKIKYRPAYLGKVIQSHFAVHGEEYYEEGKSVRVISEAALVTALATGKALTVAPKEDGAIAELAATQRILEAGRAREKAAKKQAVKEQLNLF